MIFLLGALASCAAEQDPLRPQTDETETNGPAKTDRPTQGDVETQTPEEPYSYTISEEELAAFSGTSGKRVLGPIGTFFVSGDTVYRTQNDYIYGAAEETEELVRYSVSAGKVTTVCPDPVCSHKSGSGCPFGEKVTILSVEDGVVYYMSTYNRRENKDDRQRAVYAYDLKEMKQTFLFELFGGGLLNMVNGRIYYICVEIDEDNNERYFVSRYDLASGKSEHLCNYRTYYADEYGVIHYDVVDEDIVYRIPWLVDEEERIYYRDPKKEMYTKLFVATPDNYGKLKKIASTCYNGDMYYRDGELIAAVANGSYYEDSKGEPHYPEHTITAFNVGTGASRKLVSKAQSSFVLTGDCLYYSAYEKDGSAASPITRYNVETEEKQTYPLPTVISPATLTYHLAGGVIAYGKLITYGIYREYPDQKTGSVEDYIALDLRAGKWIYTHLDCEVMEYVSLEDL